MKSDSLRFPRKATVALLLCTSVVASYPSTMWAEDSAKSAVQAVQQSITVKGVVSDAMGPVIGAREQGEWYHYRYGWKLFS